MSAQEVATQRAQAAPENREPKLTALHDRHVAAGARLVDFAGWAMPLQYEGIIAEHRAVRSAAGLFDLSHMGELWVTGPGAPAGLSYALVTDPARLAAGRAHYSCLCTPEGGIIDDLIVYRLADERFLLVPNASNAQTVADELRTRLAGHDAALDDATMRTSLVAIQGPRAREILAPLTDVDPEGLRYYAIAEGHAAGVPAHVARTGYTGEAGLELFVEWDAAPGLWEALLEAGKAKGLVPTGLGARDTLRLEAGMALYGNELDLETTPMEAGLERLVRFDKETDFVGRAALEGIRDAGVRRKLAGLELRERGIARHGHAVHRPGEEAASGRVTSGTLSPTLGRSVAMAYVPADAAAPGTMLEVAVRNTRIPAEVVPLPFYKRPS